MHVKIDFVVVIIIGGLLKWITYGNRTPPPQHNYAAGHPSQTYSPSAKIDDFIEKKNIFLIVCITRI